MRSGHVSRPPQSEQPTGEIASGSSPAETTETICYHIPPLALSSGEIIPEAWPHFRETRSALRDVWPTPNTLDGAPPRDPDDVAEWNNARDGRSGRKTLANLRQAVHDPGYQERLGSPQEEHFPTPRAEDSECAGAHRGVPDTLTSYTRVHPAGESFPTPTAYDATGHGTPRPDGSRHAAIPHHLAVDWPTPRASMGSMTAPGADQPRVDGAGGMPKRLEVEVARAEGIRSTQVDPPTPRVGGGDRNSRQALTNEAGHPSGRSGLGLEQVAELRGGIIPSELSDADPISLPPKIRALWPTPTTGMHQQDVNDGGQYAELVRASGFQVTLAAAVKLRDADGVERFPTPTSSMVTVGDMEQARYAGNSGARPSYADAVRVWPTPMAGTNRTSHKAQAERPTSGPSRGGPSFGLEDAVERFPTPMSMDAAGFRGSMKAGQHWPTPVANERQQKNSRDNYISLSAAVLEMFPTPTTSDATGGPGKAESCEGGQNLRTTVHSWATPTASQNRKSRRALSASRENGRRSGGGQSSPPALEQMVELSEGFLPKEMVGLDPDDLPPVTRSMMEQWPTPKARDWKGTDHSRDRNESGARHAGDDLATTVDKRETWPTPRCAMASIYPESDEANANRGGASLATLVDKRGSWPTPLAGNPDPSAGGNHGGMALLNAARDSVSVNFGTPTSSMKVRSGEFNEGRAPNPAEVAVEATGGPRGQLNPDWVELLMGWPMGWTNTKPLRDGEMARWVDGFSGRPSDDLPKYGPTAWADGSWESSVPRIDVNIPNRVARLKAIGNGQVSLCAATAADALYDLFLQVEAAFEAPPPEITLEDLLGG